MPDYAVTLIRIGAILAVAMAVTLTARLAARRVERRLLGGEAAGSAARKRATTLTGILRVMLVVLIWTTAAVMVLSEAGVAVGPLLAAAGVGGIALGFGAQSLVRDLIAGAFILMENQFDVGDVAEVAGVAGVVEAISLRTTVLRDLDGRRHVVPNGEIRVSSNMTKGYSRYLIDLPVPYERDPDEVVALARRVAETLHWDPVWGRDMLRPLEVLGVEAYDERGMVLRMYVETAPGRQWDVGRELRLRLQKALREEGVAPAYPQRRIVVAG